MKDNISSKTLGRQAARFITELYSQGKLVFRHADVREITGLQPKSARNFVASLVHRGVVNRLKPGLFILVPYELGHEREYLGNQYVIARELVAGDEYYISHASAMDIHQMLTQPQLVVYITSPRAHRPRIVSGIEFRFVRCKPAHLFGIDEHWLTKTERVSVSDLERTVIDGLKQPEYCGGYTEVAKGFWMRMDDINIQRLVDYALRLDIGAVIRRLGFLLEIFDIAVSADLDRLRAQLTASYVKLDPLLPDEGEYLARWRVRQNVTLDEIDALITT